MPDTNYNLGLLVWNLRVLNYLNDTYHLDVCFDRLLAEGAFEVSAALQDGRLQFVQIHSKAGKPCRVEAPFAGEVAATGTRAFTVNQTTDSYGNRVYEIDVEQGEIVLLVEKAQLQQAKALAVFDVR